MYLACLPFVEKHRRDLGAEYEYRGFCGVFQFKCAALLYLLELLLASSEEELLNPIQGLRSGLQDPDRAELQKMLPAIAPFGGQRSIDQTLDAVEAHGPHRQLLGGLAAERTDPLIAAPAVRRCHELLERRKGLRSSTAVSCRHVRIIHYYSVFVNIPLLLWPEDSRASAA